MAYQYENDPRVPNWVPDEKNEIYIRVRPIDKDYTEKLIPVPQEIANYHSRMLREILVQVEKTFCGSRVKVLHSFPKKGKGFISHPHLLLKSRIEDLREIQEKMKSYVNGR